MTKLVNHVKTHNLEMIFLVMNVKYLIANQKTKHLSRLNMVIVKREVLTNKKDRYFLNSQFPTPKVKSSRGIQDITPVSKSVNAKLMDSNLIWKLSLVQRYRMKMAMMFSMTNTSPTGMIIASVIKGLEILETFEVIFGNEAMSLSSAKTGMKQMYLNPYK